MKHRKIFFASCIAMTTLIVSVYFVSFNTTKDTSASSENVQISTKTDWDAGSSTDVDSNSSPGSIKIDGVATSKIDLTGSTGSSNASGVSGCLFDSSPYECWATESFRHPSFWIKIDLNEIKTNISLVKLILVEASYGYDITVQTSTDDVVYNTLYSCENNSCASSISNILTGPYTTARYYKLLVSFRADTPNFFTDSCLTVPDPLSDEKYGCTFQLGEFELYTGGHATHTSASTQIDAGTGVSGWTTFEPTATIPANTAVSFRFRTSSDASTWTSWSDSHAYAASIDISDQSSANRYMQVESTLSNTDGASTPTLSSYTVNYNSAVLDHVVVSPSSASVKTGESTTFSAKAYDDSNSEMSGATFTWSSDCGSVSNGVFTAPSIAGSCSVTAETTIGGVTKSASATVTVSKDTEPETPVVNPYICPASGSSCYDKANDEISSCKVGKTPGSDEYNQCDNSWCGIVNACHSACGGGSAADTPTDIRITRPTTGTYLSKDKITIRWDFSDKTSTIQGRAENRAFELLTSADDGASWQSALKLYPTGTTNLPTGSAVYDNSKFINPPATGGYGEYLFNPKDFPALIGKTVKFKLTAITTSGASCSQPINPDVSDDINIKQAAEKLSIRLRKAKTEIDNITAYPGDEVEVQVKVFDDLNNDLTADTKINFDLKTGGKIIKYGSSSRKLDKENGGNLADLIAEKAYAANGEDTITIKIGDEIGKFKNALVVMASAGDLTNSKTIDINVVEKETPVCGAACQIKDGILGVVSAENTDKTAPLVLTLASTLGLILLGGMANALPTARMSEVGGIWWQNFKALFVRGGKKKAKKIGRIYDGLSGLPIPLVYVMMVRSSDERIVQTAVSDKNGEFYLTIPENGDFTVRIKKPGFALADKERKNLMFKTELKYDNNYFGEKVNAEKDGLVFSQSIPLISAYDKPISANEISSLEKIARFLRLINYPLIAFGLVQTIISILEGANLSNLIILGLYTITILWYLINLLIAKGHDWGTVYNLETGAPVDLAIIRAVSVKTGKLVKTVVTDAAGRYSLVLTKGDYKLYVSKSGYLQDKPLILKIRSSFAIRRDKVAVELIGTKMPDNFEKQPLGSRMFESVNQIIDRYEGSLGR